jgi:hypothetical protein
VCLIGRAGRVATELFQKWIARAAKMSGRFLSDFSFALTRYRTWRRYHGK